MVERIKNNTVLNFSGIDCQVFLPIITAFFLVLSSVVLVILAKYAISDLSLHGKLPLLPIPLPSHAATISLQEIFFVKSMTIGYHSTIWNQHFRIFNIRMDYGPIKLILWIIFICIIISIFVHTLIYKWYTQKHSKEYHCYVTPQFCNLSNNFLKSS